MPDGEPMSREEQLRADYLEQTSHIAWHELQTYYAQGSVIRVGEGLNLVDVAVQLSLDNAKQFETWIAEGAIAPVLESEAQAWYDDNTKLWAVVAAPWVLVQDK